MNFWLSPSAKQRRNPCSGPPPVYQDLSTHNDRPVKEASSKRISGNSLSPLEAQNKDMGTALQKLSTGVKLISDEGYTSG